MKKVMNLKKVMMLAFAAFTALALFSCTMNAESNDGSKASDRLEQGYKPGTVQGGDGSGWDSAFTEKGYDIFDFQSWGDYDAAASMELSPSGMKITRTGAWSGGGMVCADTSNKFDFTKIEKITFDVRGKIGAGTIFVQGEDVEEKNISIAGINEETYTSKELDVSFIPAAKRKSIFNAFTFIIEGDEKGGHLGDWFEVKNITYCDAEGKSVRLSYVNQ